MQATPGTWVSGAGHTVLVVWLLAGWGLRQEPLDFQVTPVSVVSGEEFAQILAASAPAADPGPGVAVDTDIAEPQSPETAEALAPPQSEEAPPDPSPPPSEVPAPDAELPPPPPPDPAPPEPALQEAPPDMTPPDPVAPPPGAPDLAASLRPVPRPAPRVAPEAAPPPPPEAAVDPVVREEAVPQPEPPEVVEEPAPETTAPEEAAPQIVTEAEVPSGAVEASLRPQVRPNRPTPPPAPRTDAETVTASSENAAPAAAPAAVDDALDAALAGDGPSAPAGNPGPPMTGAERDAFRVSVQDCWVVDPGSEAARVTVTVAFELTPEGRVQGNEVIMLGNSGGSASAVDAAFETARRAVLRCQTADGRSGFPLPPEKFEQWRMVEMTFNPEQMRIR